MVPPTRTERDFVPLGKSPAVSVAGMFDMFPSLAPGGPLITGDPDSSLNVPLLVGLVSGFGTLFLGLLCGILWFAILGRRRIKLGRSGNPGDFDDEQAFLEAEEEALVTMDELELMYYNMAKAFIAHNPPNSAAADISLSQYMTIQEKGVSAWEFEVDFPNANCFVEGRTEIEFFDSICCSQTNLPVPRQNEVYYWEAKIYDKPEPTLVSVGLTTKPYPTFRLPGYHRYSVAYDSRGTKRVNQPFAAPVFGPPLLEGDVIGVGYKPRTGTVFFTRNGKKLEDAVQGLRLNLFPTVGATGPCKVNVNFGQAGFVFIEANVKKWGLAPASGSLAPPPPYGAEQDFVLLESGSSSHHTAATAPPPPPTTSIPHQHTQQQHSESVVTSPSRGMQSSSSTPGSTCHANPQHHHQHYNFFQPSSSPPPFHTSFSTDEMAAGIPVNISMSSLSASTSAAARQQQADRAAHAASAAAPNVLLVHTPPPSYTSETESVSDLEVDDDGDHEEEDQQLVTEQTRLLNRVDDEQSASLATSTTSRTITP